MTNSTRRGRHRPPKKRRRWQRKETKEGDVGGERGGENKDEVMKQNEAGGREDTDSVSVSVRVSSESASLSLESGIPAQTHRHTHVRTQDQRWGHFIVSHIYVNISELIQTQFLTQNQVSRRHDALMVWCLQLVLSLSPPNLKSAKIKKNSNNRKLHIKYNIRESNHICADIKAHTEDHCIIERELTDVKIFSFLK